MAEPPSSPPNAEASVEDALAWYKSQYELLEHELSEFQASSKELEAELEKDLDAADKWERQLQEKAEALGYEVEEWKVRRALAALTDILARRRSRLINGPAIEEIQRGQDRGKRRPERP